MLHEKSLEDIAKVMGNAELGSPNHTQMAAELARRQTTAQVRSTNIMWWSFVVIAITSSLSALFQFLSWYAPRIPH